MSAFLLVCDDPRKSTDMCDLLASAMQNAGVDNDVVGFDSLILVAPAAILATLLSSLPAGSQAKVVARVDRDLSGIRDQDLSRFLPLHLICRSCSGLIA
ncbi:host attachment protein [Taklimakanibacter lacteus]|uniref:host attachment protein n=1 Tax=Taklimakanibacter lacteus TaxID=2268456 RepID=UPI0013C48FB9